MASQSEWGGGKGFPALAGLPAMAHNLKKVYSEQRMETYQPQAQRPEGEAGARCVPSETR